MAALTITSPANPRLKALAALRRRRARDERCVTLVDGLEELALALESGLVPAALYWCPELMAPGASAMVARVEALGAESVRLSRTAFEKVAYREGPDGFLAVVPAARRRLDSLHLPPDGLALVCQSVEKPGNLGAMLRTADAAGVSAVVAADPVTDWGNPNVIRASKGTVFAVPVAAATSAETLIWVRDRAITLVATTPDSDIDYTEVDYTRAAALAVGAEKTGLREDLLAAADVRVRIPMRGRANSLNVATAAAVVVYEAVRQRRRAAAASEVAAASSG